MCRLWLSNGGCHQLVSALRPTPLLDNKAQLPRGTCLLYLSVEGQAHH